MNLGMWHKNILLPNVYKYSSFFLIKQTLLRENKKNQGTKCYRSEY